MEQVLTILRLLPPVINDQGVSWPFYNYTMSRQLPLTKNFPLMDLRTVLMLIFGYYISVWLGIRLMSRREKRFDLGIIPLIHNFLNVAVSAYIVVETIRQAFIISGYRSCQPMDPSPSGLGVAKVMWVFYASKVLEFGDTWIMVLKKNFRQITFLHMYHHSSVFFFWWAIISFGPNGATYFAALQNSVVHIIMYSYYFVSALQSYTQKTYLKPHWKYYITYFQLLQFVINTAEYLHSRYHQCDKYPVWIQHTYFIYMMSMITLFLNFLIRDQQAAKSRKAAEANRKSGPKSD